MLCPTGMQVIYDIHKNAAKKRVFLLTQDIFNDKML